jgi:hypothetical protein
MQTSVSEVSSKPEVHSHAEMYQQRGWAIVRVPRRGQGPTVNDWTTTRFQPRDFLPEENIGLKLGNASGGLCDVALDAPEALAAADTFLPVTGMISGRQAKPRSHRWYVLSPVPFTFKLEDP